MDDIVKESFNIMYVMRKKYPRLQRLKEPLTVIEEIKYLDIFSEYGPKLVCEVLNNRTLAIYY